MRLEVDDNDSEGWHVGALDPVRVLSLSMKNGVDLERSNAFYALAKMLHASGRMRDDNGNRAGYRAILDAVCKNGESALKSIAEIVKAKSHSPTLDMPLTPA